MVSAGHGSGGRRRHEPQQMHHVTAVSAGRRLQGLLLAPADELRPRLGHLYVCLCVRAHVSFYLCVCMCVCVCVRARARACVCGYACGGMCLFLYTSVSAWVHAYVFKGQKGSTNRHVRAAALMCPCLSDAPGRPGLVGHTSACGYAVNVSGRPGRGPDNHLCACPRPCLCSCVHGRHGTPPSLLACIRSLQGRPLRSAVSASSSGPAPSSRHSRARMAARSRRRAMSCRHGGLDE